MESILLSMKYQDSGSCGADVAGRKPGEGKSIVGVGWGTGRGRHTDTTTRMHAPRALRHCIPSDTHLW